MKGLRRGSLAIEYALLIVIVAAALIGMAVYFKRSLSGKWRETADTFGFGRQYQPEVTQTIPSSSRQR